MINGRIS